MGFFPGVFSPWPKKKDTGKKASQKMFPQTQSKISVHNIIFQGKMQFFATQVSPSEKSNDSYKLMSLGGSSLGVSSGRKFFGFDL